jgi:hypothetical protein
MLQDIRAPLANTSNGQLTLADARIAHGARLVLSREASADEQAILRDLYEDAPNLSAHAPRGDGVGNRAVRDKEVIGLTAVASALLNLDAALTR